MDANALIYLVKTDLAQEFIDIIGDNVVIDKSVYNEVIEKGIENNYPDAYIAKDFLEKNQVPIIPVDIKSELPKFRDPGETSCYILAKEEGVCISSDVRANKKFKNLRVKFLELDTFFYNQLLKKQISKKRFINILNEFKKVNGTSANRISVFLELLSQEGEKDK
ncbi:MAG: hypothetical protein GF383_11865 [Candidatus Lokiarchaeota archaeon]|nr:hypothetical protein [Candidatus Lokiarchaeota archaeon]MBD3341557.1 hypothetical protein [Candidatus Lokiarchaeota archaeon]